MLKNLPPKTRKQLGYLLSIPERTVRSLAAVGGGTTLLLTETLIPRTLQESTLYRVTIGDLQQFLIEQVAQMDRAVLAHVKTRDLERNFMPRRMAGSVVDAAGLLWIRFSPLWIFAIASDAANGSKVFLHRLVDQLKQNGVLATETEVNSLTELLDALHAASDSSAQAVNMPPLSEADIRETAVTLRQSYGRLFATTSNLMPRMESLWTQMETVSAQEGTTTTKVSGMMTLDLVAWSKKGAGAVTAVGQTGGELIGEHILDSYAHTLRSIGEEGLPQYFTRVMRPFADTAVAHFDANRLTWTEKIVTGPEPATQTED